MKKILKKITFIWLLILLTLSGNNFFNLTSYCTKPHKTTKYNIPENFKSIPLNEIIIFGGKYKDKASVSGYEKHHLISAHFCKNHKEKLSTTTAPCIMIPKWLHLKTGSHGASGHSKKFLNTEENIYQKQKSLTAVYCYGVSDLISSLKSIGYEINETDIDLLNTMTPVKNSVCALSNLTDIKNKDLNIKKISSYDDIQPCKLDFDKLN